MGDFPELVITQPQHRIKWPPCTDLLMMMMVLVKVMRLPPDVPHRRRSPRTRPRRRPRRRGRGGPEARVAAEGRAGGPRRDDHGARAGGQRGAVQVAGAAAVVVVVAVQA